MNLKLYAAALYRMALSSETRGAVRAAVKNVLVPAPAVTEVPPAPPPQASISAPAAQAVAEPRDVFEISGDAGGVFLPCSARETERWNKEWFAYLEREWEAQLTPFSAYGDKPELPEDPAQIIDLRVGTSNPLALYCDKDAIAGKRVVELGCGCGNLGKHLARWTQSYLGVDYSPLALKIARLVSPANATYVHAADHRQLESMFGSLDTAVGRYFFIHQNMALATRVLRFAEALLVGGGRLYADFYWPNPAIEQGLVLSPHDSLSAKYPSATFAYSSEHVRELAKPSGFEVVRELVHPAMQRRYVVFEKRQ